MLVVPNFSEGRRVEVMDAIVAAMTSVAGATLLNRQSDPDHNRLDATLIGSPAAVRAAALAGAAKAVELIDMDEHQRQPPPDGCRGRDPLHPHPRGDHGRLRRAGPGCGPRARRDPLAAGLPVRARRHQRRTGSASPTCAAASTRGSGPTWPRAAGLPTSGPHRIGRAGATAVGARPPLVAFNVYLSGGDERAAKEVARRVRERSGGLVSVRAIGFAVAERGCVQVSMNLLDPVTTPPYRALELVRLEAARFGMQVLDTEIVGLIPLAALAESAAHYLQLRGFEPDAQVIETLVARQAGSGAGAPGAASGHGHRRPDGERRSSTRWPRRGRPPGAARRRRWPGPPGRRCSPWWRGSPPVGRATRP